MLAKLMPPPNVNAALGAAQRTPTRLRLRALPHLRKIPILILIGARGHAAEMFLVLFVTALAVTKRCVPVADAGLVTAAMPAAGRCVGYAIANVSGWHATPRRDVSNVASSIKPGVARSPC